MKRNNLKFYSLALFAATLSIVGCSDDDDGNGGGGQTTGELRGSITTNTTLDASLNYSLVGSVTVEDGVTLTIPAGTTITANQTDGLDALIVKQGGRLIANGTANDPIVFTETSQQIGSWGGIVILGRAPINVPGGTSSPEFDDTLVYGGTDAADNSGSLQYVRVEYAGAGIVEGSVEYNGFGFYAVGTGTTLNNLQTFRGSDDGFEWFGGTVTATNLISIGDEDDSFDWAEGWTGGGSNWIAIKEGIGDRGIEADNNENDNTLTPFSNPTISDITLRGIGESDGILFRRGTGANLSNVLITNFVDGIDIRDQQTYDNTATGGILAINGLFAVVDDVINVNTEGGPALTEEQVDAVEAAFITNLNVTGADDSFTQGWTIGYNIETPTAPLTGSITSDLTLDANTEYTLVGSVIVQEGATLTIPAGTRIVANITDGLDVLIINQGAQINAVGTADNPIVFTEASEEIGSWGGIVLLGRAPINVPGGTSSPEFDDTLTYGGTISDDNSGTLSYIRLEYAGAGIVEGSVEYNGFGFYAVGSGTTLNNLETYLGSDDGFEWFGGTVTANNLISIGDEDDSFDCAEGWTGGGSNWIAIKEGIGDRGFEFDNNENDNTLTPLSNPTISDVTLIGTGESDGMLFRRGAAGTVTNAVIRNFVDGIQVVDAQTETNVTNGDLAVTGNITTVTNVVNGPTAVFTLDATATGADDTFAAGWSRYDLENYSINQ